MSRNENTRKRRGPAFAGSALLFFFISFVLLSGCQKEKKKEEAAEIKKPVRVITVREGVMEKARFYTGTVESIEKAEIFSKIPGKVERVSCHEGDRVIAGQVLIQLEDADLRAAVMQAEAALKMARARLAQAKAGSGLQATKTHTDINNAKNALYQAEANYDLAKTDLGRTRNLFDNGAIPEQQLDVAVNREKVTRKILDSARENLHMAKASTAQDRIREEDIPVAQAGIAQAEAALFIAKTQLGYAHITSPLSGIITFRGVEPGELITASTMIRTAPLLKIVDNSEVCIDAKIPQKDLSYFGIGRKVRVLVDSVRGVEYRGTVKALIPVADQQDRSFKVKVSLHNEGGKLKSGMFARIKASGYRNALALLVPRESLQERDGRKVLFVVEGGQAKLREIKGGENDEVNLEIVSGLKAGDQVVTEGQTILNDGDRVLVEGGEAR